MSSFVVVDCQGVEQSRCGPTTPAARPDVQAVLEEARALLVGAGLWDASVEPVTVALGARLGEGTRALTVVESTAAPGVGVARSVVYFGEAAAAIDLDIVLHELTHVWMRAPGVHDEARWRVVDGVADHQSALVHEGLSDFVAAALTRDPVLGERSGEPNSLRVEASCPGGLTGQVHLDAVVVSGALWELSARGEASTTAEVLSAVSRVARGASGGVDSLVDALRVDLAASSPALASRFERIVMSRGLERCDEPLDLVERASSRGSHFVAAGTQRAPGAESMTGPLSFRVDVAGIERVTLSLRSSVAPPDVWLEWRTGGPRPTQGRAPFEAHDGASRAQLVAHLEVPPGADTLTFALATRSPHDIAYGDVSIRRTPRETPAPALASPAGPTAAVTAVAEPPPRSGGCVTGGLDLALTWALVLALWRRRRAIVQSG